MAKCANCTLDAIFAYQVTGTFKIFYCSKHVPKFLTNPRNSGRLVKVSAIPAPVVEEVVAPKPTKKKSSAPVVEETPVVEEPAVVEEPPVVEEPAPLEE